MKTIIIKITDLQTVKTAIKKNYHSDKVIQHNHYKNHRFTNH